MAGELADKGATLALDAATGQKTVSSRTTYLALLTAAPSDTTTVATMTELSGAGYSRQSVTWDDATIISGKASASNSAKLTFGPFSFDPDNVTHCALVSSASGPSGDFIMYWTLDSARDAASGDSIEVAAGSLTMTID